MKTLMLSILAACVLAGCKGEPGSKTLVRGTLRIDVDEAAYGTFVLEADAFQTEYPDAKLTLRKAEARELVSLFAADSVRVIVTARELNKGERDALTGAKIPLDEYHVAQSAVAVIVHPSNALTRVRLTQLDSIFSGQLTRWPGTREVIEVLAGGKNSSTNEVVRDAVLHGKEFGPAVDYVDSSAARVARVAASRGAIAVVPVSCLQGFEGNVTVLAVGGPDFRPDTLAVAGQYYQPYQAHVFRGWYPLSTPIYIYSRVVEQDVSLGYIAFVTSTPGQKIIQNNGLVPVTVPVRLVNLTHDQVK